MMMLPDVQPGATLAGVVGVCQCGTFARRRVLVPMGSRTHEMLACDDCAALVTAELPDATEAPPCGA